MMEDLDLIDNEDQLSDSKKDKNYIISFAKLNKYFLFPFLSPFFCMLSNYFYAYVIESKLLKIYFLNVYLFNCHI